MTKETRLSVRVPATLKELIKKVIETDTHLNESDFVREAIREKILREAPMLYKRLFEAG